MKNIFTRALALTLVFALCAVSAFAAPAFTSVTYEDGLIDIATNGYTAGKAATVLIVRDGANLANLAASDIIYIDQDDSADAAQTYAGIPIADRIAALNAASTTDEDITAVNVYIGGAEVTSAVPYVATDAEEGTTVSAISVAEEEPTPTPTTYTYSATLPATSYATVADAIAALVVTKTGSDGSTATLASSDYTVTADPTAPEAGATVTLTVAITADTAATVAPVTFTYAPVVTTAYAVTVAAGTYTSLDEVKAAALTVTKTVTTNGVAAAPVTLGDSEYTVEYNDDNGTVTITVTITAANEAVSTVATYTAPDDGGEEGDDPVVDAKTAIAGTVKYKLGSNWRNGEGALVLIVNNGAATIAASAVADANGAFEVEVPAGTYTVLVRYSRLAYSNNKLNVTNYANTTLTGVVVTDGATTTVASANVDYVAMNARVTGDANDDGVVNTTDRSAVLTGLAAAAAAN